MQATMARTDAQEATMSSTNTLPAVARKISVLGKHNGRVSRHSLTLLTLVGGPQFPAEVPAETVVGAFEALGAEVTLVLATAEPKAFAQTKRQISTIRERNSKAKARVAASRAKAKAAKAAK